jgi:hypothetical protein
VAVTACALEGRSAAPIVCATDLNQIAGAPDIHTGRRTGSVGLRWWHVVVGVLLAAAAVASVGVVVRRRRRHRGDRGGHRADQPAAQVGGALESPK